MEVRIECDGATRIDISKLNPFQGNLKSLSKENYEKLKKEILELGFSEPISVWLKGEEYQVLNGHQRLRTLTKMREEGFAVPEIPINLVKAKNVKEAKKKILALTSQYGQMEKQGLYEFMHDAELDVMDLYDFRFPEIDIDSFKDEYFKEEDDHQIDETKQDEAPEVQDNSWVKRGDIFQLGNHMLMCGDCRESADVELLLGGLKVDSLVTDPPYGVDLSNKNKHLNQSDGGDRVEREIENDAISDYRTFFGDFLRLIPFNDYNTCYVFLSSQEIHNLRLAIEDVGFHFSDFLVWAKNNHVLTRKDYNLKHEWIAYFWSDKHKFYGPHRTTMLQYDKPKANKEHPTMKPIELIEQLIEDGSPERGLIYDPFLGSGTTIIASEKQRRICYGMEISPQYCQVIIERWKNITGNEPTKIN